MSRPEQNSPSEAETAIITQARGITEEFLQKLLATSPLASGLQEQINSDFQRHDRAEHPPIYPYGHAELYTLNPDYPFCHITTWIDVVRSGNGHYEAKGIHQWLRRNYNLGRQARGVPETELEVYFDAYGGRSGLVIKTEETARNPRERNSVFSLGTRSAYNPTGEISGRNYENDSWEPHIEINQHLYSKRIEGPSDIYLLFTLATGEPLILRPKLIGWIDDRYQGAEPHWPAMGRTPYDKQSLKDFRDIGINLPDEIKIDEDGNFRLSVGLRGKYGSSVTKEVTIPHSLDFLGEVRKILRRAVNPRSKVDTEGDLFYSPEAIAVLSKRREFEPSTIWQPTEDYLK